MSWIIRACIGPALWALAFAVIYALHGAGCAWGWMAISTPLGSLHYVALQAAFVLALVVSVWALYAVPRGDGIAAQVIAAGGWIGVGGTALTLFPVLGLSTC